MNLIPLLILFLPLLACAGILAGQPARRLSVLTGLANLGLTLALCGGYDVVRGGYQMVFETAPLHLAYFFPITFVLGVDGISLAMLLLKALVSLAAVGASPADVRREREFFICLNLISLGAFGAFLSLDLFFIYVFHEVALIPTFLMIGIWGSHDRKFAANQMTLYLGGASLVLLVAILAYYFALPEGLRSLDLRDLYGQVGPKTLKPVAQQGIFLLLFIGCGALVSIWPLHSWAPKGYAAAPAPTAMLHAGVLKKFGLYLLLRLAVPFLPAGMHDLAPLVLALALGNVLYIGWVTIAQKDLSLTLGYSSVMHMGYLFLGLLAATAPRDLAMVGLTGMVLLMVGHGLSAALLFGTLAEVRERIGSTLFKDMGGLASRTPVLAFLFILGALASIGVPGLANFSGEIMIFFGTWKNFTPYVVVMLFGLVISAIYMLRAVRHTFYGESSSAPDVLDIRATGRTWPYAVLAAALLALGIWPGLLIHNLQPSLEALLK
ncbi:MAG: NADH-quinone oxidoreductase subunit M [Candidatus Methylacidiphilales bacterium]|nr:NADH-quinone oxidoreductase subunit M [Candidatus Methylacidiphilales bacterium]